MTNNSVELKRFKRNKLRIAVAVDTVMRSVFKVTRAIRFWGSSHPPIGKTPSKILVLQTGGVGDVVMSLPALKAIRDRFPEAIVTLVAGPWAAEVVKGQDVVHEVVGALPPWLRRFSFTRSLRFWTRAIGLRRDKFDLGIDLQGDPRSLLFLYLTGARARVSYAWYGAQMGEYLLTQVVPGPVRDAHLIDRFLAVVHAIGCKTENRLPRMDLSESERITASASKQSMLSGKRLLLGIHPGAGNPLRHWSSERFAALIKQVVSSVDASVVVFAGPGEEEMATDVVTRAGVGVVVAGLNLRDLVVRLSVLDCLVALDSSAAHIGAALDVPVVCLFGPTHSQFGGPRGPIVRSIQAGSFECRPCTQEFCIHPGASCMDAIMVDIVLKSTAAILARKLGTLTP
jgi:ADP-heptose:LPS heptosyltransferase